MGSQPVVIEPGFNLRQVVIKYDDRCEGQFSPLDRDGNRRITVTELGTENEFRRLIGFAQTVDCARLIFQPTPEFGSRPGGPIAGLLIGFGLMGILIGTFDRQLSRLARVALSGGGALSVFAGGVLLFCLLRDTSQGRRR